MSIDIDQWTERMKKRDAAKAAEAKNQPEQRMLQQAVVSMSNLTGDPLWDKFLSFIQPDMENCEKSMNDMKDKCVAAIDDTAVRACQLQHAYLRGRYDAHKEDIELPARLHANKIIQ